MIVLILLGGFLFIVGLLTEIVGAGDNPHQRAHNAYTAGILCVLIAIALIMMGGDA